MHKEKQYGAFLPSLIFGLLQYDNSDPVIVAFQIAVPTQPVADKESLPGRLVEQGKIFPYDVSLDFAASFLPFEVFARLDPYRAAFARGPVPVYQLDRGHSHDPRCPDVVGYPADRVVDRRHPGLDIHFPQQSVYFKSLPY